MKKLVPTVALLLLAGCGSAPPVNVGKMVQEWSMFMNRDHLLVPGDVLTITAFQMPELTQVVTVSPEGTVSLKRLKKSIRAVDRPVAEFRAEVQRSYADVMPTVEVSINLTKPNLKSVFVSGRVRRPGPVPWSSSLTIAQAVSAAGGFAITAKPTDVLLMRPGSGSSGPSPRSIRINVQAILFGHQADVPLLPGDVVWAQTSAIADVGDWVELYIRRLLPINPGIGSAATL